LQYKKVKLKHQASVDSFRGDITNIAEWEKTEAAMNLFNEMRALEVEKSICDKQAEKVSTASREKSTQRSFIQLFTTSVVGLGITHTGAGRRDTSVQSKFRSDLLDAYGASHPNPKSEHVWCPVFGNYVYPTTAGHLFAYKHGQDTMDAIFGPNKIPELFSPKNGLVVYTLFEKVFDVGLLAIVPQLPNNPIDTELESWRNSEPKEYKIRILDYQHEKIDTPLDSEGSLTWRDFDNKPLKFLNDFRPRARYLYFHYCLQILRISWKYAHYKGKSGEMIKTEMRKSFWGTTGRYLPKYMLKAFVEEIGQEWEHLVDNGCEGEEEVQGDRFTLLSTAVSQVKLASVQVEEDEEDSEEEYPGED
jgi:hypothetical protein